jgi:hypothetical protein
VNTVRGGILKKPLDTEDRSLRNTLYVGSLEHRRSRSSGLIKNAQEFALFLDIARFLIIS